MNRKGRYPKLPRVSALAEAGAAPSLTRRWAEVDIPFPYLLGALLFVALAAAPQVWGLRPLPYYLGLTTARDVISRVGFEWRDEVSERQVMEEIESTYDRRYRQQPKQEWLAQVFGPAWRLLQKARQTDQAPVLVDFATAEKTPLTPEQAAILIKEVGPAVGVLYLHFDLADPVRTVLEEMVFDRGVMSPERLKAERGRQIQILDEYGSVRLARVQPYSANGPIAIDHVRNILDQRFARVMPRFSLEFRGVLRDILLARLTPSLEFDREGSEKELADRKSQVRSETNAVHEGEVILPRGKRITPEVLAKLRVEEQAYAAQQGWELTARRLLGKSLLLMLLTLGFVFYYCATRPVGHRRARQGLGVALTALAALYWAYGLIWLGLPMILLPLGLFGGLLALALEARTAALTVTCVALMLMVVQEGRPGAVLALLGGAWLFVCVVPTVRHKLELMRAAAASGGLAAVIVIGWSLASGESFKLALDWRSFLDFEESGYYLARAAWLVAVWLVTGATLMGIAPFLETWLGATTNMRLQELQDQNQPCLRRLVVEAPGTYHHSVIVGTLAEAAASTIGASALLAKVGGFYHDIGKLTKPEYFTENEIGVSRHDALAPTISALIIAAHVKDGAEMAAELGLPGRLREIIEQHHGSSLIGFFHYRAKQAAGPDSVVDESLFHYPGPIPQSREAALVMLADCVEAASRSLERASSAHIKRLVHELLLGRLLEGQLEDSGLTLTDLNRVEESFVRILTSMFHSRVRYPHELREDSTRRR